MTLISTISLNADEVQPLSESGMNDLQPSISPLNIGNQLQLAADKSWQDQLSGEIRLALHAPVPGETIPEIADPHGYSSYRYMTVFQDGDLYRMYYALPHLERIDGKQIKHPERICYAESKDGIHWKIPSLGIYEYNGDKDNNIVWMEDGQERLGVHGFSPFKDMRPGCPPEQRYKAIAEAGPKSKETLGHNGLLALVSADGIHWQMLTDQAIMAGGPGRGNFDTQNVAFWDTVREEYRLYRREVYNEGPLNTFRDILTATSQDFLNWSEPVRLEYPGALAEQLYTNGVLPYFRAPHLYVGFPVRYVQRGWGEPVADLPERERRETLIRQAGAEPTWRNATESGGQRIGTALTDTLFMISRDGVIFDKWDEAFIRPGLRSQNNWFYGDNFPAWGIVTTRSSMEGAPDELSFYVTERSRRSDIPRICRRYTLRVDGFVSVQATMRGGEVLTKPLVFTGEDLYLNFSSTAAGSLQVELQTPDGNALPGFQLQDCVEILGDDLERKVRWKHGKTVQGLVGQTVRLRFVLKDADLYSFQFR